MKHKACILNINNLPPNKKICGYEANCEANLKSLHHNEDGVCLNFVFSGVQNTFPSLNFTGLQFIKLLSEINK